MQRNLTCKSLNWFAVIQRKVFKFAQVGTTSIHSYNWLMIFPVKGN